MLKKTGEYYFRGNNYRSNLNDHELKRMTWK